MGINLKIKSIKFMKKRIYLFFSFVFLLFIGCSTIYRVADYPSKEEYYEDINNSIKNRDVNVVTIDSSFVSLAGSEIKGDSLRIFVKIPEEKISLKDVKEIKYFGKAYEEPSAYVWLKNGEELRVDNINKLTDSMIQLTNLKINSGNIPINKVKEISYKTAWTGALMGGMPIGLGSGVIIGGILGSAGIIFHINTGGMTDTFDKRESTAVGAVSGALIGIVTGAIIGYIIGWDNIYQLNH